MTCRFKQPFCKLLLCFCLGPAITTLAAPAVLDINHYQYSGKHNVDFSSLSRGPIGFSDFTQGDVAISNANGFIQQAIRLGLEQGNGNVVASGAKVLLSGEIIEASVDQQESTFTVIFKAKLKLRNLSNKILFQGQVFGKGKGDSRQSAAAVAADKLVTGLMLDEYFLAEILD